MFSGYEYGASGEYGGEAVVELAPGYLLLMISNTESGRRVSHSVEISELDTTGLIGAMTFSGYDYSNGNSYEHTISFSPDGVFLNGKKILTEE